MFKKLTGMQLDTLLLICFPHTNIERVDRIVANSKKFFRMLKEKADKHLYMYFYCIE